MGEAGTDGGRRIINYTENLNYMLTIKKFDKKNSIVPSAPTMLNVNETVKVPSKFSHNWHVTTKKIITFFISKML